MDLLPIRFLNLETGVFLLFLLMMIWTQLQRASEPGYYIQFGRLQATALILLFSLMLLFFASQLLHVSPLLAVELAAGFTLALLHPANALCLFVHMLYLRPWEITTGNPLLLALPRLLAALCVFSWLIHPSLRATPDKGAYRRLLVILSFAAWLFVSTFGTPDVAASQSEFFDSYFKAMIVLIMSVFFLESERSISEFENTIVLSSLALMAVGLCQYFTVGSASGRLESIGLFGNSNDLAAVIVMAVPFALVSAFGKTSNLFHQIFGLLFAGCSGLVIWYTRSRGAVLALFVQVAAARFSKVQPDKRIALVVATIFLAVGGSLLIKAIPRESGEMAASEESRTIYWKAAVNMALHHPLFGVGYTQYNTNYDSYSSGTKYEWGNRTCHSSWFLPLAEAGIPGGILFTSFFAGLLGLAWRNRARWPGQCYSLIGYCVAMSFLSHTYLLYPYFLAGLVIASGSLKKKTDDE